MATATEITPLAGLQALGQSVWIDFMSRKFLTSGELRQMIEEDGLQGATSNPTIFEKAINQSTDYDDEINRLIDAGRDADAIYQSLTVADIQQALDLFRSTYNQTDAKDGYVSLEVSPLLAHDTVATIAEAKLLAGLLDRPNTMIKVPATPEGLPAIEELLFSGISVNVTLLFSVHAYEEVARVYIKALQRRVEAGLPIDKIASVASFFVSRIDSEIDSRLEKLLPQLHDPARTAMAEGLFGKIAIANAKNAYAVYEGLFSGPDFAALRAHGAQVQRLLWASVGVKNPRYPDTLYIDELIGPDTVSTMPPSTYEAFRDHGTAKPKLLENLDQAREQIAQLELLGISLDEVTTLLLKQGVLLFAGSFDQLMGSIRQKREMMLGRKRSGQSFLPSKYDKVIREGLDKLAAERAVARFWAKEATLWKSQPEHTKIIANSLGWLEVARMVRGHVDELTAFAEEIATAGFTNVVLMGMGGSSLCPEVFRRTNIPIAGHPELLVLDSTVPATVRRIEDAIDPAKTLFVVASKSGSTKEPSVFYAYFFDLVKRIKGERAGENFVAITDPGTKMDQDAQRDGFRKIFRNPSDIGGRYSALSFFGMVPAALIGLDVADLLDRAIGVMEQCGPNQPLAENPGARLGAALGALALAGRDKVTLVTPAPLEAVGLWIEQLIAESTGKEGKGIVPVAGETLGVPPVYGNDRVFVQIRTADHPAPEANPLLRALAQAGHPVFDQILQGPIDLGAEFFRWEIATPLACWFLGIDPFDQPNVQESKDNTVALLKEFTDRGRLPEFEPLASFDGITLSIGPEARKAFPQPVTPGRDGLVACLKAHLARVRPGDYIAITQYFDELDERDLAIQSIRTYLRDTFRVATTTGYGPRFLHSTGQLHKGGADNGVFLQLTADDGKDLPIPGDPFGFATLAAAQALGDFQSLVTRNRRAVRIHLGDNVEAGLAKLAGLLKEAIPKS